jgi:putative ABC transport system permease protein
MTSVLARANRNFLLQHPWQLMLALTGIALGVAVVIAIDLALESSLQSFQQINQVVSGKTTHRIIARNGSLDEKLYTRLRVGLEITNLAPVLQGNLQLVTHSYVQLKIYGIDPFIEDSFQSVWQLQTNQKKPAFSLIRLVSEPNTALIGKKTAEQFNLGINDNLSITTSNGTLNLKIIGILNQNSAISSQILKNLIITDISTAQEILNQPGKLSFIEFKTKGDKNDNNFLESIRSHLPADILLTTSDHQIQSMRQMTKAFNINLKALGMLSLLIGMFLIYNTMTFLVIQRRRLIGSLRCIGVTRRQIFTLIITEALLLGIIGSSIGIIIGIMIGNGLLQLTSTTIETIYYQVGNTGLIISPEQLVKGMIIGIGATFLAILPPAWEATKVTPNSSLLRSQLETNINKLTQTTGIFGLVLVISGIILAFVSEKSIFLGLSSIFILLFGFALMTPGGTVLIMKLFEKFSNHLFGIVGALPPKMVSAEISRTGVAIAALMIAVSATIGMDLMINSFRQTVSDWITTSLRADYYISASGGQTSSKKPLIDQRLKDKIATLPGVEMLSSVLHTQVISESGLIKLSVFELNDRSKHGFIFKKQIDGDVWQKFEQQHAIFITESFAYFRSLTIGDTLFLDTKKARRAFTIIGIYSDFSGDQGHIAMTRKLYLQFWNDSGFTGIGIYADKNTDLHQLESRLHNFLSHDLLLKSNQSIYKTSMEIFEQTFVITNALRWIAAGIAFTGIFSALMALQFERIKQFGILRAIGVTRRQLSLLIMTETGLIGLVAGIFAIPVGYFMAYILIFIVYLRSFGWTMVFHFDASALVQGLALALLAALLAGILPAIKMAQTRPAEALRTE